MYAEVLSARQRAAALASVSMCDPAPAPPPPPVAFVAGRIRNPQTFEGFQKALKADGLVFKDIKRLLTTMPFFYDRAGTYLLQVTLSEEVLAEATAEAMMK